MNHPQFNSSLSSLASASSSTLIVTPHPYAKGTDDNLFSMTPEPLPKRTGIPMTRSTARPVHTKMSGNGFIEPHHSHLPRRTKKRQPKARSADSFDSNKSEGGFDSKDGSQSLSRDPERRRPMAAAEQHTSSPSRSSGAQAVKPTGPLQPHVSNLPRRHIRRPQSLARQREHRLCLQEIGRNSRVFVGTSGRTWAGEPLAAGNGTSSSDDDDDDPDEEEEDALRQRFSAIVRLIPGAVALDNNTNGNDDTQKKGLLRLSLPGSEPVEDGFTRLTTRQIRLACGFLHRALHSSSSNTDPSLKKDTTLPALILAPPDCATDAFALAVCYYSGTTAQSPPGLRPSSPGIPPLTPRTHDSDADTATHNNDKKALIDLLPPCEMDGVYSTVHQLVMKLHDEDLMVLDDEDGQHGRPGHGDLKPGQAGLREEWRGLLRYEGISKLEGVWTPVAGL